MARYINADEALRISKEGRFMWAYDLTDLEEFLTNVPSVDAVEVVRCKDCLHCDSYTNYFHQTYYGCCWTHDVVSVDPNHFCSYGERRREE